MLVITMMYMYLQLFYSELCSNCASWLVGVFSIVSTHVHLQGQLACESESLSLSLSVSVQSASL